MTTLHERVCDRCGRQLERKVVRVTRVDLPDGQTRLHVQCQACAEPTAARQAEPQPVR